MNIKSITLGLRAVASVFGLRLLKSLLLAYIVITAVSVATGVWLIGHVDTWWVLLFAPVWLVALVVGLGIALGYGAIVLVRPRMDSLQRQQTTRIVDHLEVVRDVTSTPKLFIIWQLVWSVVLPQSDGYLQRLMGLKGVHSEFMALVRSFDDRVA